MGCFARFDFCEEVEESDGWIVNDIFAFRAFRDEVEESDGWIANVLLDKLALKTDKQLALKMGSSTIV